jgi:arginine exporter protein ArgO
LRVWRAYNTKSGKLSMQFKASIRGVFSVGFVIVSMVYFVLEQVLGLLRDYLSSILFEEIVVFPAYPILFLIVVYRASSILLVPRSVTIS